MSIDPIEFRQALGVFPTGVVVITAVSPDGDPIAITVSSFNSVSLDPPLVLFSISRTSSSLAALLAAERFAISVLANDQREVSRRFARPQMDKFSECNSPFEKRAARVIESCLASFECRLFGTHDGGDHLIIIGEVEHVEVSRGLDPLVFFRGNYRALSAEHA